ncbi:MAG TPA: DUF72 domain-containing protein [Pyrinomonadaceae bacterium]|nr:DUF72 domain-containing protein [Pyrinomonadaceae bacterium]
MKKRARRVIKAGCCGFRLSQSEYATRFPVVEVQQTFYQPPQVKTLERWRADAPPEFEFTLKAWQLITHEARSPTYRRLKRELTESEKSEAGSFRPTPIVREAWEVTLACVEALRATRVLFQCPSSFTPTQEHVRDLREFFTRLKRPRRKLAYLWEPRGNWPEELVRELCAELDLTHVVDPFATRTLTPGRSYYRLHGRTGWRYRYEDDELAELVSMLPAEGVSYVLFNNVRMLDDAERFQELVREQEEDE